MKARPAASLPQQNLSKDKANGEPSPGLIALPLPPKRFQAPQFCIGKCFLNVTWNKTTQVSSSFTWCPIGWDHVCAGHERGAVTVLLLFVQLLFDQVMSMFWVINLSLPNCYCLQKWDLQQEHELSPSHQCYGKSISIHCRNNSSNVTTAVSVDVCYH